MSAFLVALLDFIRKIDLTSIIVAAARGVGGPAGWIISLFARPLVQGVENELDAKIQQEEKNKQSDAQLDKTAAGNETKISGAQSDDDFDQAARDSLHKH